MAISPPPEVDEVIIIIIIIILKTHQYKACRHEFEYRS